MASINERDRVIRAYLNDEGLRFPAALRFSLKILH